MEKADYNRIKIVLAEKKVKNKTLVEALGVNKDTVTSWCVQRKQPSLEQLFVIADYLEVDVRALISPNEKSPRKDFKF
jgi:putative transcriptional regulator